MLNAKYYGPRVKANPLIESEWSRIPHFYYNFYVYKYATGFCAAEAFTRRILSGDQEKIDAYLGFLKAGSSKDPIDILADAGVDMRKPDVVESALSSFDDYIKELSDLL